VSPLQTKIGLPGLVPESDPGALPLARWRTGLDRGTGEARRGQSRGVLLAAAALYFLTGRPGLLAMPGGHVTLVWPPSGIALAAVLAGNVT